MKSAMKREPTRPGVAGSSVLAAASGDEQLAGLPCSRCFHGAALKPFAALWRSEFSGAVGEARAGVSSPRPPQLRPAAVAGLEPAAPRASTRCCGGNHGDPGLSGAPHRHVGSDSRHDCKNNSEMLNYSALFWFEF